MLVSALCGSDLTAPPNPLETPIRPLEQLHKFPRCGLSMLARHPQGCAGGGARGIVTQPVGNFASQGLHAACKKLHSINF